MSKALVDEYVKDKNMSNIKTILVFFVLNIYKTLRSCKSSIHMNELCGFGHCLPLPIPRNESMSSKVENVLTHMRQSINA